MEGRVGGLEALSPVSGWPTACATISCDYCRAVLSFQAGPSTGGCHVTFTQGLPAVRYADHLSNEHRILFQQVTSSAHTKPLLPRMT